MPYSYKAYLNSSITNLTATKVLGSLYGGSFTSGTLAGWSTGQSSETAVTFTSTSPNADVPNLTAISQTLPTILVSNGGGTETATVTFKPLAAGQTLSIAGLTFTVGTNGATASQLALAFANINNGTAIGTINTNKNLGATLGGSFTGGPATNWNSGTASGEALIFTSSSVNADVSNLTSTLAAGSSTPSFVNVDGGIGVTETTTVTFKPLAAGQTLSIAGLTFTVGTNGATASQLALAFANINNGTAIGTINTNKNLGATLGGSFTGGSATNWNSGTASGEALIFTSSSVNSNVDNLSSTLTLDSSTPTISVTEGRNNQFSTETALVSFASMAAGRTLSIAGLTFTAGANGATALEVAKAFANIAEGTTADHANNTPYIYDSAYVVTPGAWTTTSSLFGYINKPIDGNSYTFLASGSFTVPTSTTNTTIAAIKGTVTNFKIYQNGNLAEEIDYGASIPTTMFGVTSSASISPAVLSAQRAQATLQNEYITQLMQTGSTFTGSNATNGGIDQVVGGASKDTFTGNINNDYFDGKGGIDTAIYQGNRSNYIITTVTTTDRTDKEGLNKVTGLRVTDGVSNRDGVDDLINCERIIFSDKKLAFDISGSAGQTVKLINAIFGKSHLKPEYTGIGINLFDQGLSTEKVIDMALQSDLYKQINPNKSSELLINNLYTNVVGQSPSNNVIQQYQTLLDNRVYTENSLTLFALNNTLNEAQVNLTGIAIIGVEYF
jgi:hypothetical protein